MISLVNAMEMKKIRGNLGKIFLSTSLLLLAASSVFYWNLVRLGYAVPIPYILDVLCLNKCPADDLNILHTQLPPDNLLNYDKPLIQILGEPDKLDKNRISILVEKSKYRLTVYDSKKPVKSYPVVFGGNPAGDKLKAGICGRRKVFLVLKICTLTKVGQSFCGWIIQPNNLGANISKLSKMVQLGGAIV